MALRWAAKDGDAAKKAVADKRSKIQKEYQDQIIKLKTTPPTSNWLIDCESHQIKVSDSNPRKIKKDSTKNQNRSGKCRQLALSLV